MTPETRERIERGLREWGNPDSESRRRFESAQRKWDALLRPIQAAIEASERLTEDDFAIRINVIA